MDRGDVRWLAFKTPDKTRPVLILSRDVAVRRLSEIVVASFTTKVRHVSSEVVLTPADGMPRVCAVNFDQLHTVRQSDLGPLICRLDHPQMKEVRDAVLFALGFE